jgi:hypothetical protein
MGGRQTHFGCERNYGKEDRRAGGALKGNVLVAAPSEDNMAKVALTIGNVFGLGLQELGKGPGLATAEVPGIRA